MLEHWLRRYHAGVALIKPPLHTIPFLPPIGNSHAREEGIKLTVSSRVEKFLAMLQ